MVPLILNIDLLEGTSAQAIAIATTWVETSDDLSIVLDCRLIGSNLVAVVGGESLEGLGTLMADGTPIGSIQSIELAKAPVQSLATALGRFLQAEVQSSPERRMPEMPVVCKR